MSFEECDLVIVGAGISGIAAARFYLHVHPKCRLVILEKDAHVGGVWNSRRVYEHFWTQGPVGSAEFSDLPMTRPPEPDTFYEFFKSEYTTKYLEEYIDHQNFDGRSLRDRIRFEFDVQKIRKVEQNWIIAGKDIAGEVKTIHSPKLIVASGLTSVPNLPNFPGTENFEGPIIHQMAFGGSSILSTAEIKHVTVVGGAKSAADMIYACVKAGKSVNWVIRSSGAGPGYFIPAKGKGPYKNVYAAGSTRMAATLAPSLFHPDSWWTRFLHRSGTGRKIMDYIWSSINDELAQDGKFDRTDAKKGFDKMAPHSPIFWQNGTGGLLNRPDFWDTIAQNVDIYHDDILQLDKGLVRLQSGEEISTDAILCGTGWKTSLGFFEKDMLAKLDVPHDVTDEPVEDEKKWAELEQAADNIVLDRFPTLANPPEHFKRPIKMTPYRLYKGIAPSSDDSIVFIGHVLVGNYFHIAEYQAIWATAYLDHKLKLPSEKDRLAEIALFTAWCRRRYLSNGEKGNWLIFDMGGYADNLLEQIGLTTHRKSWFSHYFAPCTARDLASLAEEYISKHGRDETERSDEVENAST